MCAWSRTSQQKNAYKHTCPEANTCVSFFRSKHTMDLENVTHFLCNILFPSRFLPPPRIIPSILTFGNNFFDLL
jgi:hypothetical protein